MSPRLFPPRVDAHVDQYLAAHRELRDSTPTNPDHRTLRLYADLAWAKLVKVAGSDTAAREAIKRRRVSESAGMRNLRPMNRRQFLLGGHVANPYFASVEMYDREAEPTGDTVVIDRLVARYLLGHALQTDGRHPVAHNEAIAHLRDRLK